MTVRIGVVTFPGSLDDRDARRAVERAGAQPVELWHDDASLHGVDAVVLPGGFSYGDYLRCGAIARFAPVMSQLVPAAAKGLPVLGICNGFQILCEAHLLPGALTRNAGLRFVNRDITVRIENQTSAWTRQYRAGQEVTVVLKSGEGAYMADPRDAGQPRSEWPDPRPLCQRQPKRVGRRHRRRRQRRGERGRPDATSRARYRGADRAVC